MRAFFMYPDNIASSNTSPTTKYSRYFFEPFRLKWVFRHFNRFRSFFLKILQIFLPKPRTNAKKGRSRKLWKLW
jgi:hypothetical protein